MGVIAPPELLGVHINLPSAVPDEVLKAAQTGGAPPPGLSADESRAFDRLSFFFAKGATIFQEMGSRPQTLYGIADSPVGLAAWFLDHDKRSYELIARAFDGQQEGLTRDDILDNVTLAWLTNTAVSSSRLYWENKLPFFTAAGVAIPVAVSAFPDEIYQAPQSWVERAYPKLIHYKKAEKGGHFAAWEQPKILVQDVQDSFRAMH
jgi:pimeloyl-ACP methyl ester carboxylesterase